VLPRTRTPAARPAAPAGAVERPARVEALVRVRVEALVRVRVEALVRVRVEALVRVRVEALVRVQAEALVRVQVEALLRVQVEALVRVASAAPPAKQPLGVRRARAVSQAREVWTRADGAAPMQARQERRDLQAPVPAGAADTP
jgi:hypothetical protein